MKSTKMSLDVRIFLIICIVGIFGMLVFLAIPKKATGRYAGGAFNIVNRNDIRAIKRLSKYKSCYAIKIQEKDKYFLELYDDSYMGKYTIDKDKYNIIEEGNYYWFYLNFSKPGEVSSGSIKNVYDNNPLQ